MTPEERYNEINEITERFTVNKGQVRNLIIKHIREAVAEALGSETLLHPYFDRATKLAYEQCAKIARNTKCKSECHDHTAEDILLAAQDLK